MADVRNLAEPGFGGGAQLGFLGRVRRLHQAYDLAVLAVEAREELAPGDQHAGGALADRLALAVPGPRLRSRWHVLDQLEHVLEAGDAISVAAREQLVLVEYRAAVRPEPSGPVAVERVVARLQLSGSAE